MSASFFDRIVWAFDPNELAADLGYTLDPWQRTIIEGRGDWLACCGRQVGKSTVAEVKALHTAIRHAGSLSLIIAPGQRQSQEVFKRVADDVGRLGIRCPELNKSGLTLDNGSRILALPGTGSTIRGYSKVMLAVIDEAAFVVPELFAAVRPMLLVSGGDLLVMSTPFLKGDYFDTEWNRDDGVWQRVQVLTEECQWMPADQLAKKLALERASLPPVLFDREYRCIPMESSNLMFSEDVLNRMFTGEERPLGFEWGATC